MRIRKSGKVNKARHAQCIAEINTYRISFGSLKAGTTWKTLLPVVDYCEEHRLWSCPLNGSGWVWLLTAEPFECCIETSCSINDQEILNQLRDYLLINSDSTTVRVTT